MSAPASLIPELEDVIQHGSAEQARGDARAHPNAVPRRRADFNDDHVGLFDDVSAA